MYHAEAGTTWRQRVGWTGPDCSQRRFGNPELGNAWSPSPDLLLLTMFFQGHAL